MTEAAKVWEYATKAAGIPTGYPSDLKAAVAVIASVLNARDAEITRLRRALTNAADDLALITARIDDNQVRRAQETAIIGQRQAWRSIYPDTPFDAAHQPKEPSHG